jgi:hypothetical protein
MKNIIWAVACCLAVFSQRPFAAETGKYFDRAIMVILENTDYSDAIARPFLKRLADGGANFTDFIALSHPSQGNYFALTSGSLHGVKDDENVNLKARNIIDLLEAHHLSWKIYAEEFPGGCYTGAVKGKYARKHNPFISYLNIQKNRARCAHIVEAAAFAADAAAGALPNYAFYIPNLDNNGHDTGVAFADKWYAEKFSGYIQDPKFMAHTFLITTFDENGGTPKNQVYTSIFGPEVVAGNYSTPLNSLSLLKLVESNWNLGNLGRGDVTAPDFPKIWVRSHVASP